MVLELSPFLFLATSRLELRAHTNADWVSDSTTKKSTVIYYIFFDDSLFCLMTKNIVHLRNFLADITIYPLSHRLIFCDNNILSNFLKSSLLGVDQAKRFWCTIRQGTLFSPNNMTFSHLLYQVYHWFFSLRHTHSLDWVVDSQTQYAQSVVSMMIYVFVFWCLIHICVTKVMR